MSTENNVTTLWYANRTAGTVEALLTGTYEECKSEKDAMIADGFPATSLGIFKTLTGTRFDYLKKVGSPNK
jgi:hypothetical protein